MHARLLIILPLLAAPVIAADGPATVPAAAPPQTRPAQLHLQWTRQLPRRKPMWADLERWPGRDIAYEPVIAGTRVFIGCAHNDAVVCFDLDTGDELWRFYADGPVRFAPIAADDMIWFATGLGHVYCVDAAKGTLLWKSTAAPESRKVIQHDRLISAWPISAGPVMTGDALFIAIGSLPADGTFAIALDAKTGKRLWMSERLNLRPWGHLAFDGEGIRIEGMGGEVRLDPKTGQPLPDKLHPASLPATRPAEPLPDSAAIREVTADGRLITVTIDGRISCFGPRKVAPQWYEQVRPSEALPPDEATRQAALILEQTGRREGFCVVMGLKDGRLVEELLRQSKLRVVAIEADAAIVDAVRRYMDKQGLYDSGRLAVHLADPLAFALPAEVADLVVSEDLAAGGFEAGGSFAHTVFNALRTGQGAACLPIGPARQAEFAESFTPESTPGFELVRNSEMVLLLRKEQP